MLLESLKELRLSRNKLEALPQGSTSETRHVSKLKRLLAGIGKLKLKVLDLADNTALKELPISLHQMDTLAQLLLDNNVKMTFPPWDVCGYHSACMPLCPMLSCRYACGVGLTSLSFSPTKQHGWSTN